MAAFEPGERAGWFPASPLPARLAGILTSTDIQAKANNSRIYAAQVFPRLGMTRERESTVALALRLSRTSQTLTRNQPVALTFAPGFQPEHASGQR